MRWQTNGARERRWWHQTQSNVGISISGRLKFYFTWVEFHILRGINYSEMMQRISLRSRLHQIRVLCLWVTRRNWGHFLSAGAINHLRPNQPNMPTATSTKLENVEGWQENPKCVPSLCLLYSNGMYSNTVKITLEILHLSILNLWNVHSVTNSNLYITICT